MRTMWHSIRRADRSSRYLLVTLRARASQCDGARRASGASRRINLHDRPNERSRDRERKTRSGRRGRRSSAPGEIMCIRLYGASREETRP